MAEVTLPELGESITEGIVTDWLVAVGDTVEVDQPIVEISTDKVDTEIPSPVAGVVQELRADVDDTIEVGQVIAIIGENGEAPADTPAPASEGDEADEVEEADAPAAEATTASAPSKPSADVPPAQPSTGPPGERDVVGDGGPILASPLVRRMLREARVPLALVKGTGPGGRVTRADAEAAVATGPTPGGPPGGTRPVALVPSAPARSEPEPSPLQVDFEGQRTKTEKLTRVRTAIAKAMMNSLQSTAQLTAAVEVDVTRIMNLRAQAKDAFKERVGASLSPLPIMARATCIVIPRHPAINGSMDLEEGTATFHDYINLGMAVDTDRGLLVPNIKDAQDLDIAGLAAAISDVAARTRDKKIKPDDLAGATFTITNTGSRGTLFDTPILNPPEVAILATCAIEKRPVVVTDETGGDAIAVRWMTYLCMTYDHRMIDGADAARFLQDLKYTLETHDFSSEVF